VDRGRSMTSTQPYVTCKLMQVKERRCDRGATNAACTSTQAAAASTTTTTAVELGRKKILRHQNANHLDGFTTLAELMALGSRDATAPRTRTYNPLLSVTTV